MTNDNLLPPLNINKLIEKYRIRATKGLGQNFLIDEEALMTAVDAAQIQPGDHILEIGPGLGTLTRVLAQRAEKVISVELDKKMLLPLKEVLSPYKNVEIINRDILQVNISELMGGHKFLIVANIPYNITSALIRHILESETTPSVCVLMVQKEVAERICAKPGNLSLLALSVQLYGSPSIISIVPASSFDPAPKVDSALIKIELFATPQVKKSVIPKLFRIAKAGFGQKRKKLRNSLSSGLAISTEACEELLIKSDIDPQRRAQTLSLEEWNAIAMNF
jgi:16S rRNA (adenine1518-N6/adenine1519-N6)-dimethyltransferase